MPWRAEPAHGGFSDADPWLPLGDGHAAAAVDRQITDENSVLQFTRAFFRWRKTQPLILHGGEDMLNEQAPLLIFDRYAGDDRMRFVVNFSTQRRLYPSGEWRPMKAPGCSDAITSHGIELPAHGFAVLKPND
jgi:alpha-glucosidase